MSLFEKKLSFPLSRLQKQENKYKHTAEQNKRREQKHEDMVNLMH